MDVHEFIPQSQRVNTTRLFSKSCDPVEAQKFFPQNPPRVETSRLFSKSSDPVDAKEFFTSTSEPMDTSGLFAKCSDQVDTLAFLGLGSPPQQNSFLITGQKGELSDFYRHVELKQSGESQAPSRLWDTPFQPPSHPSMSSFSAGISPSSNRLSWLDVIEDA